MPYRIDIYIGSDNGSRKINDGYLSKVRLWADKNFPTGYTMLRGQGCYGGFTEDSLLINVLSDCDLSLKHQIERLKDDLRQDAIIVAKHPVSLEII